MHAGRVQGVGVVGRSCPRARGAHVKARSATRVFALYPLSRNLRHLRPRPRVAESRGELRADRGARGGSATVTVGSLGMHMASRVLAEGRRPRARVPIPCGPHPGAPSAAEALATSARSSTRRCARPRHAAAPAETVSRRRAASGDPSVACDQHLTLRRTQRRTSRPPHGGGLRARARRGAASPGTGGQTSESHRTRTRPSRSPRPHPRPHP